MTPATTVTQASPTRLQMSYEEFLQWAGEDTHAEWVNGEVIVFMPPKDIHQATLGFLYWLLHFFVHLFDLGKLRIAPFEVSLPLMQSCREPDLFFVATASLSRLTAERMVGPPELIIEIISDDSVQRDRRDKFREYRLAGVREYWIIDPRPHKQRADFFRLDAHGDYELFATEDDERVNAHVLPGFWIRPAWLWQTENLDPLQVFCDIRGLPTEQSAQIKQLLRGESGMAPPP